MVVRSCAEASEHEDYGFDRCCRPECEVAFNSIRPGEKIHEPLVSADEARYAQELDDMFVIEPMFP